MAIPIIDLSSLANRTPTLEETTAVGKACLDFGFFYVINHGIPGDLQAKVLEKLWNFFSLSAEMKEEIHRRDGFRGYFRKQEERSIEYNCTEWKEGIYYFRDFKNLPEEKKEKAFCGLNPWPKAEYVPDFRAVIEDYFRRTQELASKLLSCIALSLGMNRSEHPCKPLFSMSIRLKWNCRWRQPDCIGRNQVAPITKITPVISNNMYTIPS